MVHNQPRYNTLNVRRVPLYGRRGRGGGFRSVIIRAALILAVLFGAMLGGAWLLRAPLAELWLSGALRDAGFADARLEVISFGPDIYEFRNISMGLNAGSIARFSARASVTDLLRGRADSLEIDGLYLPLTLQDNRLNYAGVFDAPLPFTPANSSRSASVSASAVNQPSSGQNNTAAATPVFLPVADTLTINDARIVITELHPEQDGDDRHFSLALLADLKEVPGSDGRADGKLSFSFAPTDTEGNDAAPWASAAWEGTHSLTELLQITSATQLLSRPQLLSGSASVNARIIGQSLPGYSHLGPLTLTGDVSVLLAQDHIDVSARTPVRLNIPKTDSTIIDQWADVLPSSLQPLLDAGIDTTVTDVSGDSGFSVSIPRASQDHPLTSDIAIALQADATKIGGAIKGQVSNSLAARSQQQSGSELQLDMQQVRFVAENVILPQGRVSGVFELADLAGDTQDANGAYTLSARIDDLSTEYLNAAQVALDATGQILPADDGISLTFAAFDVRSDSPQSPLPGVRLTKPVALSLVNSPDLDHLLSLKAFGDGVQIVADMTMSMAPLGGMIRQSGKWNFYGLGAQSLRIKGTYPTAETTGNDNTVHLDGFRLATPYLALVGASGTLNLPNSATGQTLTLSLSGLLEQLRGEDGFHRDRKLQAHITQSPDGSWATEGSINLRGLEKALSFEGATSSDFSTGQINFSAPSLPFTPDGLQPGQLHDALAGLVFTKGVGRASGIVPWGDGRNPDVDVRLEDADFSLGPATFYTANAAVSLSGLSPLKSAPGQPAAAAVVDFGIPAARTELTYHFDGTGGLVVERAGMDFAGGRISIEQARIPLDGSSGELLLAVDGLSVAEIATQAGLDGLSAEGELSGTLPLRVENHALFVDDARFEAPEPGMLKYMPNDGSGLKGTGQPGVEILLSALSNFEYETLAITLSGPLADEMDIGLSIKGANPAYQDGKPVEFNLTVQGKIAEIIRQSVRGYTLPDRVRERIERIYGTPVPPQ